MGVKKERVAAYCGHLLEPWFRYITKAELFTSPVDARGNELAHKFHNTFAHLDTKLVQPNYQVTLQHNDKSANAYLKVHYSIGWVNKYVLSHRTYGKVQKSLNEYDTWAHQHVDDIDEELEVEYEPEIKKLTP